MGVSLLSAPVVFTGGAVSENDDDHCSGNCVQFMFYLFKFSQFASAGEQLAATSREFLEPIIKAT